MLGSHPLCLRVSVFNLSACVHLLIPLAHGHALTPAVPIISLCFYLCHLHLFVPFSPLPPSSCTPMALSYHHTFYVNILINLHIILNI